ncbi:MAG: leucyl/phenylalanyl-tRNA--protein transferase [Proteobacteria bacterium]|nr:leucyl/phenylalanyl-tRNA--protein transferase [Pseudomonadota bacterium]
MTSHRVFWLSPDDPPENFPPLAAALREPEGLLAAGGDLNTDRLLYAYRKGIFPWYEEGQPLLWWSPNPRCVFLPGDLHISRRTLRELRRSTAEIRVNTAFAEVVRACAGPRRSQQGTWITQDMMRAYQQLHKLGWAHSIEVWQSGKLSGGLYGLAIGKVFFGESMFSLTSNASKIALLLLARQLDSAAFELLDCQVVSSHLRSLGARCISRGDFAQRLNSACHPALRFENWPARAMSCSQLLSD